MGELGRGWQKWFVLGPNETTVTAKTSEKSNWHYLQSVTFKDYNKEEKQTSLKKLQDIFKGARQMW